MENSTSSELFWINSFTPNTPSDGSKHRREVMQKVALRRKGKSRQHHPNSRQLPVFIRGDDASKSSKDKLFDRYSHIQSENPCPAAVEPDELHLQTSLTQLRVAAMHPSMLVRSNLDFADLSSLASLHVGRYTGQRLIERPRSIAHFLGGTSWSYCRYLSFYYAQSVLLRTAADCVVARVRYLLTPEDTSWESLALTSYSDALSHLQEAINSTSQHPTAEVLCATQILSLYEVGLYLQFVNKV
jgi:hypothetical protein